MKTVERTRQFGDEPVSEHWLEVRAAEDEGDAVVEGPLASLRLRLAVPVGTGRLLSWESAWGAEWEPAERGLDETVALVSLAGRSSARRHPFAVLELDDATIALAVAWSGNWEIVAERLDGDEIELRVGMADPGFSHALAPGEVFATPAVVVARSPAGGREEVARALARVGRRHWFARRDVAARMPVEWNPWWPYEDAAIDESTFLANAAEAARRGFDVAVLDAGWFGGADATTFWYDVRGDWERVNTVRFPSGLTGLAEAIHGLELGFGLWLEVEAVGPRAHLREARPELLAVGQPAPDGPVHAGGGVVADPDGRPVDLGYVCLGNPDARDWAFATIAGYARTCRLDWLKLDFNLDPGLGCTRTDHGHGAADGLWAHVTGLYEVLDRLRAAFPGLLVEACSSGGMRWDHGIARHADVGFQSDPDWPDHSLSVFWAASLFFPAETLLHWCDSEWRGAHPRQTFCADDPALDRGRLDFVVAIAMLGPLGLSQRLVDLPGWAQERVAELVALHHAVVGPCVAQGELRRLSDQPRRDGVGPRWVGFQFDVPGCDPAPQLVAAFRLGGAEEACPLVACDLPPDAEIRVRSLLDDAEATARVGSDGRLPLDLDLAPERAWLATLHPCS